MSNPLIAAAIQGGQLWISNEATRELKSKRMSPFFFNSGNFSTGETVAVLAEGYAAALKAAQLEFDVLYGPPYKGIPLAATIAMALYDSYGINVGFTYSRKEEKTHGERGDLVGADLAGKRVVIVDDVVTTGGTKNEAFDLICARGGQPVAISIAFDRQERGTGVLSAVQELREKLGIPVIASATTQDLIDYLTESGTYPGELVAIKKYYEQYGAAS